MDFSPSPFVVSLSPLLLFLDLSSLGSWTCPYSTTNQQHGIPCFINEKPPNWPVRTRECVVKGGHPLETMPKNKSKKKKERGKGKEEEEGEGIPLKQMNEYRRSNRMEFLTKEQHDAKKAVIRANNQKAEEALKLKGIQTQLDQTERSNTQISSNTLSSSNTQSSSRESTVSDKELEKIELERRNLECARDFQRIDNMDVEMYY